MVSNFTCKIGLYVSLYFIITAKLSSSVNNSDGGREKLPEDEDALSLWLITRTGWVFCERATEYMKRTEKDFDTSKCKKCYRTLFNKHKLDPSNVTNGEYKDCINNFGRSKAHLPSIGFPPTAVELVHQNPFESVAVQPYTCNSELRQEPQEDARKYKIPSFQQIPLPSLRQFTQLLSVRGFSYKNDPKVDYPRRSYVICLLGALFETELSLCPMSSNRRKCAAEKKEEDENLILSKTIPITYEGTMEQAQSRFYQYSYW